MKHIVCYSGGHSSALVAVEVVRKFGKDNVILLNHDISFVVEDADIKRFKNAIAEYLNLPITYASHIDSSADQFDVCVQAKAFKVGDGTELCTNRLKTAPFMKWLKENVPDKDCVIYYGFDKHETARIQRRIGIMGAQGYKTDFPVALWQPTILATEEIGIHRPLTYSVFKHGNCKGCLKAGQQHWYIIYCTRQDIWLKAKWAEEEIGYSILHNADGPLFLEDLEPKFEQMKLAGVPQNENIQQQVFLAKARKFIKQYEEEKLNYDCSS